MSRSTPIYRSPLITLCLVSLSLVVVLSSCGDKGPTGADGTGMKKWTFLFYDDADFSNAYDPIDDFGRLVRSGENVHVLVLVDTEDGPAAVGYIDSDHMPIMLRDLGEVNMGSASTLSEFITYAKENYPAERYIISFYDHGGGWLGACWDVTSGHDNLTMGEMKEALSAAGGVDLVLFSAPCLMGSFEAAYNLRDCTDIYIGSEAGSGYGFWRDAMEDICDRLHTDPQITTRDLGVFIIASILEHATASGWTQYLTMSAVATDRLLPLKDALDTLSLAYLDQVEAFRSHLDSVYQAITLYSSGIVDLYHFAEGLLSVEHDPQIRQALTAIQQHLDDAVLTECHGSKYPGSHGLTIFLPDSLSASYYLPLYTSSQYGLDVVEETHWDELLTALFGPLAILPERMTDPRPPSTDGFIIPPAGR